ncbi:MAG: Transcription elongation factor GreA, partial [uncultured Solirubrobacteraceae bacterium]
GGRGTDGGRGDHRGGPQGAARRAPGARGRRPRGDRAAHLRRPRDGRPQGERRVPHRQGGPGPPGDEDPAPPAAAALRGGRRGLHGPGRGGLRRDGARHGRGDGPRGLLHARGPDGGRPQAGQAVGRVAHGPGAHGRARRLHGRGPGAARDPAPADRPHRL